MFIYRCVYKRVTWPLAFPQMWSEEKNVIKLNNLNWDFLSLYISHAVSYSCVCLSLWHRSNIGLSKLTLCAVSSPQKCTSAQSLDLWLSTFLDSPPFDVANWPLFAPIYLSQICSMLISKRVSVWIQNTNLLHPPILRYYVAYIVCQGWYATLFQTTLVFKHWEVKGSGPQTNFRRWIER